MNFRKCRYFFRFFTEIAFTDDFHREIINAFFQKSKWLFPLFCHGQKSGKQTDKNRIKISCFLKKQIDLIIKNAKMFVTPY